jgi:hypothetical protein
LLQAVLKKVLWLVLAPSAGQGWLRVLWRLVLRAVPLRLVGLKLCWLLLLVPLLVPLLMLPPLLRLGQCPLLPGLFLN